MARVPDIVLEEMTAEQRRVYQEIGGARGGIVRGPFAIWLRNPEIADHAKRFGNAPRLGGKPCKCKRAGRLQILPDRSVSYPLCHILPVLRLGRSSPLSKMAEYLLDRKTAGGRG